MEIRLFRRDETPVLMQALNDVWSPNHILSRDEELLQFMFYDNPVSRRIFGAENYGFLGAWLDDKVIGLYGMMAMDFNSFGHRDWGMAPTNWIVSPAYRHTGAGLKLLKKLMDFSPAFILNLGITPVVNRLYQTMGGYHTVRDVPRWIGISNRHEAIDQLLTGDSWPIRYYPEVSEVRSTTPYTVTEGISFEAWDEYYWGEFAKRTVGFARDSLFLKWRYLEHPRFTYRLFSCRDKQGKHKGLFVLRIESILDGASKIGRLVEFIAEDQDSAITLANQVVSLAYENELLFTDFYCFSGITAWGLEAVGFRRVQKSPVDKLVVPTRFQPLDLEVTHMMAAAYLSNGLRRKISVIDDQQWYVTKGDADQDRPN